MTNTSYSKFLAERYATALGTSPDHLWDIFVAATDAGVEFRLAPLGGKPFHARTNQPTIFVVCDDDMQESTGPGAFHRHSLWKFVKRCTGAVIISSEPRVVAYAAAAARAAGSGGRNVIIVETRAEHEAGTRQSGGMRSMPSIRTSVTTFASPNPLEVSSNGCSIESFVGRRICRFQGGPRSGKSVDRVGFDPLSSWWKVGGQRIRSTEPNP